MTKKQKIVNAIIAELERAEKIHPVWPADIIHQGAIITEESGRMFLNLHPIWHMKYITGA